MYLIYNLLLLIFLILFSPVILIAFIIKPKLRAGFWQKIGFYKIKLPKAKTILIHAVSVGEINAVENFVRRTYEEFKDYNIVVSTVTKTGQEVAKLKLYNYTDKILYFPYDFLFSIKAFIHCLKPDVVLVAETEIWPNFVNQLYKKKIPIMIINGRISPNSYKGYKKISFFFKNILSKYKLIMMQTSGDKHRIIDIGSPEDRTVVMGNLKFDIKNTLTPEMIESYQNDFQSKDFKVIIAGSTHQGEDEVILSSFAKLKAFTPKLKLLLAPRHPERYPAVVDLLSQTGLNFGYRSKKDNFLNNDIILLDTMGELGKLYSISDIAFIGGSFTKTGGHNPLEATIFNVPTLSGPCVYNFKDIYKLLVDENAAIIVNSEEELFDKIKELLSDVQIYGLYSNSCNDVFSKNSGALEFATEELKKVLD